MRNRVQQLKQRIRSPEYGTNPRSFTSFTLRKKGCRKLFAIPADDRELVFMVGKRVAIKMPRREFDRLETIRGATYDKVLRAMLLPD